MKIRRRKLEVGIPYLPMADIAFNLVLFFIMMAKVQDDRNLLWIPARVPQIENVGASRITVTVDENNKTYLNGKAIRAADLTGAIEKQLSDESAGKRMVRLKIHKDTLHATFAPIIEAVSQAGGEVVHVLEEDSKK